MSFSKVKAVIRLGVKFQEGSRLSRRKIEEHLNISPRTVYHYIEDLKRHFNAPIAYDYRDNSYYCNASWSIIDELKE